MRAGGLPRATGRHAFITDEDLAIEKSARCQHHRVAGKERPIQKLHALETTRAQTPPESRGDALAQSEIRRVFQVLAGCDAVLHLVRLGPGSPHRYATAFVQNTEMNSGRVYEATHRPAQRVQLTHHVALAHATDARIAAHLADLVQVHGQQRRGHAHASGDMGCLDPRMTSANDHNVLQIHSLRALSLSSISDSDPAPLMVLWNTGRR